METWILRWGYLAVGFGTFLEGESVLIAAGALAHHGALSLPWVMLTAFVGSIAGDQLWFQVGLKYGEPFLTKRPKLHAHSAVVDRWLGKYGTAFVLGFRFFYGLRIVTPLLLGASHYSRVKFAALNFVGGALWSLSFGLLGYCVGASLTSLLHRPSRAEEVLLAALAIGILIASVWWRARGKRLHEQRARSQA